MVPLLILAAISTTPPGASGGDRSAPELGRLALLRVDARATATVTILTPAMVGADLGAPRPGMTARVASLTVPGGSDRLMLVYDFE